MEEIFFCPGCMAKTAPVDGKCPVCGCNVNMENAPHQLPVNTILYGRYIVGRVLGAGGFGITYIGYDLKLDGRVAIKEYYPSGAANRSVSLTVYPTAEGNGNPFETGKERFLKEARVLSGFIEDSSIVTLRDYFEENGTAYIVMEYLDGEDLSHYAVRHGKFTFDEALDLLEPAMLALDKVHKKGLIHRDISPSNLMVLSDGRIKVLDFGAARLQSVNGELRLSVMLKPGYAPIEQYSTHGEQGPWTDVYAMSATFYRLITGKAPTSATDRTCGSAVELPSALGVKITPAQEGALMHGLALQSADRTQTMAGLAESLRAKKTVHGSKPEKPKAPEKPEKTDKSGKPALPKKRLIAIGASALVVLAACLTLPALRNGTDSSAAKQEEQTLGIEELALARESIAAHSETTVSSGTRQTAGIKSDGTVCYSGGYQEIEPVLDSWTDIVAVSAGLWHTVGLKSDGTVVSAGSKDEDSGNVMGWTDIVAVSAGWDHTVGLKADGTAVSVGPDLNECGVADWQDIRLPLGERKELGTENKKTEDKKPESAELSLSIDNALLNETTLSTYRTNTVGLRSDGTVVAAGSNEDGECDVSDWRDIIAVSTGNGCIFGLKANGTVIAVGNNLDEQCEVSNWTNIVAVSAGQWHTVGLRADGTVVAVGSTIDGQCSVSGWRDIVAVSAGSDFTAGLRSDGTVVATGQLFDVSGWKDIAAISAGGAFLAGLRPDGTVLVTVPQVLDVSAWTDIVAVSAGRIHTVGLKSDGTLVAVGENRYGQCDSVGYWKDIIAVSAGYEHTVGLKAGGTVVAAGNNSFGQCDVGSWTGIVAVSAGEDHTVALRADGTVVAVGNNDCGQCDVSGWTDIIAVSAGSYNTVGLKSDGTVVAAGSNENNRSNVTGWKDIRLPVTDRDTDNDIIEAGTL